MKLLTLIAVSAVRDCVSSEPKLIRPGPKKLLLPALTTLAAIRLRDSTGIPTKTIDPDVVVPPGSRAGSLAPIRSPGPGVPLAKPSEADRTVVSRSRTKLLAVMAFRDGARPIDSAPNTVIASGPAANYDKCKAEVFVVFESLDMAQFTEDDKKEIFLIMKDFFDVLSETSGLSDCFSNRCVATMSFISQFSVATESVRADSREALQYLARREPFTKFEAEVCKEIGKLAEQRDAKILINAKRLGPLVRSVVPRINDRDNSYESCRAAIRDLDRFLRPPSQVADAHIAQEVETKLAAFRQELLTRSTASGFGDVFLSRCLIGVRLCEMVVFGLFTGDVRARWGSTKSLLDRLERIESADDQCQTTLRELTTYNTLDPSSVAEKLTAC